MTLCPVCQSPDTFSFLEQRHVPVHQNMVYRDQTRAHAAVRGDLVMHLCSGCDFVFNSAFDPQKISYDQGYDNSQNCSPAFSAYMDKLIDDLIKAHPQRPLRIVEIGCGKGEFLKRLVQRAGTQTFAQGYDPTYEGPLTLIDGRLAFVRRFFDEHSINGDVDIILCRHVIEHIPDPFFLLMPLARALKQSPQARIYFETPQVEWIFEHGVLWDFFYEHCALYNHYALATAFSKAGLGVVEQHDIFGDQYQWLEARPTAPLKLPDRRREMNVKARAYAAQYHKRLEHLHQRLSAAAGEGKIALWGAGAKGVTLANLLDPAAQMIDCVIDMNPNKQGAFLVGTGHPIAAPAAVAQRGVRSAFVMNPNYLPEIRQLLIRDHIDLNLIAMEEVS